MKEEDPWDKTHLPGKREHLFSLSWGTCTENATNNHSKTGILTEPLKAFLKVSQHLLCCVVGLDSINRNLHFLKSCLIKGLD
jgi:hypothetical protein